MGETSDFTGLEHGVGTDLFVAVTLLALLSSVAAVVIPAALGG
jgi:hypothetical protein